MDLHMISRECHKYQITINSFVAFFNYSKKIHSELNQIYIQIFYSSYPLSIKILKNIYTFNQITIHKLKK